MPTLSKDTLEDILCLGPRGRDVVRIHNHAYMVGFGPDSHPHDRELQREIMVALET